MHVCCHVCVSHARVRVHTARLVHVREGICVLGGRGTPAPGLPSDSLGLGDGGSWPSRWSDTQNEPRRLPICSLDTWGPSGVLAGLQTQQGTGHRRHHASLKAWVPPVGQGPSAPVLSPQASRKTKKKEGGALRAQRASSNVFSNFEQTQIQEFKEVSLGSHAGCPPPTQKLPPGGPLGTFTPVTGSPMCTVLQACAPAHDTGLVAGLHAHGPEPRRLHRQGGPEGHLRLPGWVRGDSASAWPDTPQARGPPRATQRRSRHAWPRAAAGRVGWGREARLGPGRGSPGQGGPGTVSCPHLAPVCICPGPAAGDGRLVSTQGVLGHLHPHEQVTGRPLLSS